MSKSVREYTDPAQLRQLMVNARRQKRDDIYWEAFHRLCSLEGIDQSDPLHREFYSTLRAYEDVNAGVNLQRRAGAKVQHGRKQEGPRYRGLSCLSRFFRSRRPGLRWRARPWHGVSGAWSERA